MITSCKDNELSGNISNCRTKLFCETGNDASTIENEKGTKVRKEKCQRLIVSLLCDEWKFAEIYKICVI
jgi:hypothetical protein